MIFFSILKKPKQHDGYLNVWNWKKGDKLACNRVTNKVNALSFSKDGTYLVTAGLRHIKFWYFDSRGRLPKRVGLLFCLMVVVVCLHNTYLVF